MHSVARAKKIRFGSILRSFRHEPNFVRGCAIDKPAVVSIGMTIFPRTRVRIRVIWLRQLTASKE